MQILVVDDEASIRELLSFNLKKNGYSVETAADGREALAKAAGMDLVLLDIMLPEVDGLEVCRRLKADPQTSGIPIIMLTAKAEEIDRVLGLELGADDYVVKPFSMRELLARVKAVLRRFAKDSQNEKGREETLKIGGLRLDFSSYQAWLHDEPIALTPKEYELLKLLVTNPGRAFTRDELLERIWGYEYYGDTRTVDVHIRHLRAKLKGDENISKAIETVRGIGYRFARRTA
ncbi:winged helix-turn-helix domain-containing protein [Mitsuokella jalaludinii]|uniref:winged helix-turn-helix domain-containing protein n=1 Tax=Mitsuokella jalaludinii TaxID=187979 RepID=UPI001D00F61D|nr:response regulator transcription factor [Mitsuokella jalaludinii]MCB5725190.1 response regulator transcription factor [Mitsuokella jalaludinii]